MANLMIVSGGQSGVDRAALEVAVEKGIDYGGWCPQGGWAEDIIQPPGVMTVFPNLRETPSADPAQRTEWNVRDSDVTLVLVCHGGLRASEGTRLTAAFAQKHAKPLLVADLSDPLAEANVREWLKAAPRPLVLNIAGCRESEAPGIYARAKHFLRRVVTS
jgi:hypothetical protein